MLIDELDERASRVSLEFTEELVFEFDEAPYFLWDNCKMLVDWEAFDDFLNILRIPIKYAKRCLEALGGTELAQQNINFWIKQQPGYSLLLENDKVGQIIQGDRIFVPGIFVNDVVVEKITDPEVAHWLIDEDTFHAVYVGPKKISFRGSEHEYNLGVRVLYSDSFAVTPHFDGVLYEPNSQAMYCWPVQGRKFRTVNISQEQFNYQIREFVDLALIQILEDVLPALEDVTYLCVDPIDFVYRLCSDLRANRNVRDLVSLHVNKWALSEEAGVIRLIERISSYCNSGALDFDTSRDIQVALTNWIVERSFK